MRQRFHFRVLAAILALLMGQKAFAYNEVEYQVAWKLGEITEASPAALIKNHKPIYFVNLLPERLFRTNAPIVSNAGAVLLREGAQLVLMDAGSKFLICSLLRGAADSISANSRVCLLDAENDGNFEAYFTKDFKPGVFSGEGQIFGLAGKFESFAPLQAASVEEVDTKQFSSAPKLEVIYAKISDGKRNTLIYTKVGGIVTLPDECPTYVPEGVKAVSLGQPCFMPGATLKAVERQHKQVRFEVLGVKKSMRLRFRFIKGIFDYRIFSYQLSPI